LILPVLFLTLKHAANIILIVMFIGALHYIYFEYRKESFKKTVNDSRIITILFWAPILAIAISQIIRKDLYINNYDAPFRLLLSAPVFLAISDGWLLKKNGTLITELWIKWIFPVSLLAILICRHYFPSLVWTQHHTTYFVDPLSFSAHTLLMTFMIIIGTTYYFRSLSKTNVTLCMASIMLGFYLAATSGARTGWITLPLFILIWWKLLLNKFSKKHQLLAFASFFVMVLIILRLDSQLVDKLNLGWDQFSEYKFNNLNNDTSVGMRISFYRMGIEYFLEKPFSGWGDISWLTHMNSPQFLIFATEITREAPKHGFHNEILTSAVRSGIWGLIASLALYIIPLYATLRGLKINLNKEHYFISILLLVFIIHLFFVGISTEVTNLTFLSAYIGILLSVLLGEQKFIENNTV
jgi:O-antigen ligase